MRVGVTGFESYLGSFLVPIGTFRLEKKSSKLWFEYLGSWPVEPGERARDDVSEGVSRGDGER